MLSRKECIASARITGLAAGYAQIGRLDRGQALAEIGQVLAPFLPDRHPAVLTDAASAYVGDGQYYAPAALALLVEAGADPAEAVQPRAARPVGNPFRIVADQANAPRRE